MSDPSIQKLPPSGPAREALRQKGQFWTPRWIAEAMVGYALTGNSDHLFDPAVGAGAFFQTARIIANETGRALELLGTEIDPAALQQARDAGVNPDDLDRVQIRDFVLDPPARRFAAIVANPPYIRHHRLSAQTKAALRSLAESTVGQALDGRAGLHIYFLIRALSLLEPGGRLAFIMPADTCEGIFAPALWRWIAAKYRLDAVITFAPDASPFPAVDTNPLIFLIQNARPEETFRLAMCHRENSDALRQWVFSAFEAVDPAHLTVHRRHLSEGVATGLSRPPRRKQDGGIRLGDLAGVMRGIATGDNVFFLLTREQADQHAIPDEFLFPVIARTRDVPGDELTSDMLRALDSRGRPTLLFSPDGRPLHAFPPAVQRYLESGEQRGTHQRTLISTRRPWYKMETRPVPPILFAYLGRRNARFIRNRANALPLTCFLAVYPHYSDADFIEQLWQVLSHPETLANLSLVGKSYGSGAIKVEPRALEKLPLPTNLVQDVGLSVISEPEQLPLF